MWAAKLLKEGQNNARYFLISTYEIKFSYFYLEKEKQTMISNGVWHLEVILIKNIYIDN